MVVDVPELIIQSFVDEFVNETDTFVIKAKHDNAEMMDVLDKSKVLIILSSLYLSTFELLL